MNIDLNEPEKITVDRLTDLVRHGYKTIDVKVRKDGVEYWFEADWLARLLRDNKD